MKTRPPFLPVLLAVLGAALAGPLAAADSPASSATTVYRVLAVEWNGFLVTHLGDSAITVVAHLGQPDQKLSYDTWVYRRYKSPPDRRYDADCTMLLVRFREGRVAEMNRVNEPAVLWLAAQLAAPAGTREIIAQK